MAKRPKPTMTPVNVTCHLLLCPRRPSNTMAKGKNQNPADAYRAWSFHPAFDSSFTSLSRSGKAQRKKELKKACFVGDIVVCFLMRSIAVEQDGKSQGSRLFFGQEGYTRQVPSFLPSILRLPIMSQTWRMKSKSLKRAQNCLPRTSPG